MSKNIILQLKPENNFLANVIFLFLLDSKQWPGFYINIICLLLLPVFIIYMCSNLEFYTKFLLYKGLERTLFEYWSSLVGIFFVIFIFVPCCLYRMKTKYFEKIKDVQFEIYENKIKIVGEVPYLKTNKLYFSEIDEIVITQNFIQKMFNLISIEFITSKESIKKYNPHHVNMVFFNIKNAQETKDILMERFNRK